MTSNDIVVPKVMKIVVLGTGGVGKSALTVQFIQGIFVTHYDPTIEDSYKKQCIIDDIPEPLEIIDTAGQEQFLSMRDLYLKSGHGFLLVFSLVDRASFFECIDAHERIVRCQDREDVPMLLVGNKSDMAERYVTGEEIHRMCLELKIPYIECSAKTAFNVDEVFHKIVRQIRVRNKVEKQDSKKPSSCLHCVIS